jgi:hypothetical protein
MQWEVLRKGFVRFAAGVTFPSVIESMLFVSNGAGDFRIFAKIALTNSIIRLIKTYWKDKTFLP